MNNSLKRFSKGLTLFAALLSLHTFAFVSVLEDLHETEAYKEHFKKITEGFKDAEPWRKIDTEAARRSRGSALGFYRYSDNDQADRDSESLGSVNQKINNFSMAHNSFISFIDQATRPGGAFFADVTIENIRDELYNLSTNDYTDIASRTNSYMSSMTLLSFILNTLPETDEKMSLAATALATAALASSAGDPKEAKTVLNEMTSVPNIPEKIRSQGLVALSELVQSIVHPSKESSTTAPEPPKPQNMHR